MIKRLVLIPIIVFITLVGLKGIVIAAGGYETAVNEENVFVRKQMYQEALDAYARAIQLNPDASEVWYNKAVVLDYLGKYGEAVNSFEKAIQYKPDYYEAWYMKGRTLDHAAQYEEAIKAFDKAVE